MKANVEDRIAVVVFSPFVRTVWIAISALN